MELEREQIGWLASAEDWTIRIRKEKKRKDYAFRRQFNEKPSIIPGCPVMIRITMPDA